MKSLILASSAASLIAITTFLTPVGAQTADMRRTLEELSGTFSVISTPMVASGQLTGCTLVFEHFQRDDLYLGGNFVKVSGSLGIMGEGGQLGFMMKAIANEFDPETLSSATINLARIYLLTPDYHTNFDSLIASYPTEVPGGILSAFQFDPGTTMLLEAFSTGVVLIAIGPESGTSDIQVAIDLEVEATDDNGTRTRSGKAMTNYFACVEALLTAAIE